jgi:hypothetical protein
MLPRFGRRETDCARTLDQGGQHVRGSAHAVFGTLTGASTLPGLWWQDDFRRDRRRQPALSSLHGLRLPREHSIQFQIDGMVRRLLDEMLPGHFPTQRSLRRASGARSPFAAADRHRVAVAVKMKAGIRLRER